jgi:uncharacterized membrane protein
MSRGLPLLLAGLALAGLSISTYLTITHWGGTPIACAGVGDCEYVNSSPYATLAGLPVSGLGATLYAGLLASAFVWWLRPGDVRPQVAYWGTALAGFGYAGYLTYVELYVLDAVCVWCMTSAALLTLSLALSTLALLQAPSEPVPACTYRGRRAGG